MPLLERYKYGFSVLELILNPNTTTLTGYTRKNYLPIEQNRKNISYHNLSYTFPFSTPLRLRKGLLYYTYPFAKRLTMSFAPRSPAPMPRGERQKHSPYPCPEFERMTIEDNAEQVLRLYDSGVPFFTKEALYELQRQIRNSFPGEIILVKALNGDVEPFENKTGKKLSSYNEPCPPDMEWAM